MIDTVKLWISSEQCIGTDLMAETPLMLTAIKGTSIDENNKPFIEGYLDTLFVRISENGILINGSLSKYYFGNNQQTLTFKEIGLAFDKIEQKLKLPIKKAKVQIIDIAENYIVDYPVGNYLPCMGELPFHKRQEMSDGLYYNGSNKKVTMYDKVEETKFRRKQLLTSFKRKNVFRYELRFKNRYAKLFDRSHVLVSDILEGSFLGELIESYRELFFKIYKHKSLIHYSELQINDRAQFWNQIKLSGIKAMGGELVLLQAVKQARKDKAFKNNMHATRIIQDIKNTYINDSFTEPNSLVIELEHKVTEKLDEYLLENGFPDNIGLPAACLFN